MSNKIRRDIYSVKEREGGPWCHVFMTRDRNLAHQRKRNIERDHSLGIRRQAKVVHPSQHLVDFYCLSGNSIH